jgi:hypothetical protein
MRCCRRELTGVARCIALSSIAMFVYKELNYKSLHRTIPEAVNVLLLSLKVTESIHFYIFNSVLTLNSVSHLNLIMDS